MAVLSATMLLISLFVLPLRPLRAWGGTAHSFIIDAALTSIPAQDRIAIRLGSEVRHLRNTVQMGDWVNSLIVDCENWHVTTEDFPLIGSEYFGNDYLLFPKAPHTYSHVMPQVAETYTPFFLRTLQALRTEDATNASRWMGTLLHFVTDSGSPSHTIPVLGPNHTKMENWLDASTIDLRSYHPMLLGRTDVEALAGLQTRMAGLIARNKIIAQRMVPYAQADDRAHLEPLAMDCATETAKVAADVIHTLLVLTPPVPDSQTGTLVVTVTAPFLPEHPLLPAKLVLLGTDYSTLSESVSAGSFDYAGSFHVSHLPPGRYHAAVERPGSATLFPGDFVLEAGHELALDWKLVSAHRNLVQNSDFALHWVRPDAPDHWHYEPAKKSWISDNIPVTVGNHYLASVASTGTTQVHLEWMAQHWKTTDDAAISLNNTNSPVDVLVPATAVYVRFVVDGVDGPNVHIRSLSFARSSGSADGTNSRSQVLLPPRHSDNP
ncbi:carboxypeptidase-like regulatory domain-containing protein [Granulicella sp. dw_53]|uniref:carboxypeptidase-like regulatory domain-containing protein n=1 Tax=Granulicella sp. dw_53 TaxID=2719792 RepID=UPI001BD2B3BA|nr:carboxypeptidase-like regulatory domain-containing protein [Granulicella sp. dw_53]